eukprot:SAG22_NODE_8112_length_682_cov_0.789022_2_plen_125_part_01
MQPHVRQLPVAATEQLDDKRLLATALIAAYPGGGESDFAPRTHVDMAAFVRWLGAEGTAGRTAHLSQLFFVKHRHGVKGQAVHPVVGSAAVLALVGKGQGKDWFVVQEEVGPPMLLGRGGGGGAS